MWPRVSKAGRPSHATYRPYCGASATAGASAGCSRVLDDCHHASDGGRQHGGSCRVGVDLRRDRSNTRRHVSD